MTKISNYALPGNPRYQPKSLVDYFGYDNLYKHVGRVEYAALKNIVRVLVGLKLADKGILKMMDQKVFESLTTSEVDEQERKVTKHDIRAFVQLLKPRLKAEIAPYLHILLTSYDVIDTAAALRYKEAYEMVTRPAVEKLLMELCAMIRRNSGVVQIGRTHGQHAVPITVGFWLATITNRIMQNLISLDFSSRRLVGKISGPVGAYNAYEALGLGKKISPQVFETMVLSELGLIPAPVSTQIVPPEPLADYLFAAVKLSASLAQFANDCRHLMRSEISEIREEYAKGQVGSSTMAHKRNPIVFENIVGAWLKNRAEYFKVMETLVSEHQRDLTGSSLMRDFPTIVVNLQTQLDNLMRRNDEGKTFLSRIQIDKEALDRNFQQSAGVIMAEPIYIALQLFGYEGDAHKLVNEVLLPKAKEGEMDLYELLMTIDDPSLKTVLSRMPKEVLEALCHPEKYTGKAEEAALRVASDIEELISSGDYREW